MGDQRRGSNAWSQSSLSSSASSIAAARDLWRLRQTMHCLEQCNFYHGNLNRNEARERMRRCRPGCFIIRDSNDPQFLFTLQQTLHFVGPCATRIAFVNGLFRFDQDTNGQVVLNQNGQRAQDTSRGFPCVLRLIEHYSAKYADMNVVALRYPVLRDDMKIQDGIGKPHSCCVEPSSEELSQTPRMMHPEVALSLAGSSGAPSCVSCTSHSGPTDAFNERKMASPERVSRSASDGFISINQQLQSAGSRQLNNDALCKLSFQSLQQNTQQRNSIDLTATNGNTLAVAPNELKTSLSELQDKMHNAQNSLPSERLHQLCPEIEPMVNTDRRSSFDINKGASPSADTLPNGRPNGNKLDDISSSNGGGGLQLSRDLYSLKMKNGLPLSELARHIPPAVDDSTDYSLNSNFANVQIDLDNLAQVLGSTSIQVTLPPKCNSPATSGGGRASTPTTTVAQQPVDDVYH